MKQDQHPSFIKARRTLILDHPFFASLVLYLTPVQDPKCKVAWVDGKRLGYNPEAFAKLLPKEAAGILAHEVLHCALEHHVRRKEREVPLWNDAADHIVNPIILNSGLSLPRGCLSNPRFADKTAEEVYRLLKEDQDKKQEQQQPKDGKGSGEGQGGTGKTGTKKSQEPAEGECTGEVRDLPGDSPGGQASPAEQSASGQEWQVSMQQALNNAKAMGKMPAGLEREVIKALEPRASWRELLRRFFTSMSRNDLSWMRPNRRYLQRNIYLPSLHSEQMGEMVVAVDTSGSIGAYILEQFASEINAIVEDVQPEKVHVVYCDAAVGRTDEYTAEDLPIKLQPVGGGGTSFIPVFDWVEKQGIDPACLVYLTDLMGSFPKQEPLYPVLWAATTKQEAPFGETIFINE